MKVLIVSEKDVLGQTLKIVIEKKGITAVVCDHKEALNRFLSEEPEVVLICDCDEQEGAGKKTWQDIKNSAGEEKILLFGFSAKEEKSLWCGFSTNDNPCYLQFPFKIETLVERMK